MAKNNINGVTIHSSTSRMDESYVNSCVTASADDSTNLDNMLGQLNKVERAEYETRISEVRAQKMVDSVRKDAETVSNMTKMAHYVLAQQLKGRS
jgi:hypothetical protein